MFEPFDLKLRMLVNRIENSYILTVKNNESELNKADIALETLSPERVMERGYSVIYKNDKIVVDASKIEINDNLKVRFAKGNADVKVLKIFSE